MTIFAILKFNTTTSTALFGEADNTCGDEEVCCVGYSSTFEIRRIAVAAIVATKRRYRVALVFISYTCTSYSWVTPALLFNITYMSLSMYPGWIKTLQNQVFLT